MAEESGEAHNYNPWWHRLPISIIIAVAFIVGAYRISEQGNGMDGFAMMTVAILLVGVWVTIELYDRFSKRFRDDLRIIIREELSRRDQGNA